MLRFLGSCLPTLYQDIIYPSELQFYLFPECIYFLVHVIPLVNCVNEINFLIGMILPLPCNPLTSHYFYSIIIDQI